MREHRSRDPQAGQSRTRGGLVVDDEDVDSGPLGPDVGVHGRMKCNLCTTRGPGTRACAADSVAQTLHHHASRARFSDPTLVTYAWHAA